MTHLENLKLIVSLVAVIVLVVACSRQHSESSVVHTSSCAAPINTNLPGKAVTTKDGFTFYVGAITIKGTNGLPLTNVQVGLESPQESRSEQVK